MKPSAPYVLRMMTAWLVLAAGATPAAAHVLGNDNIEHFSVLWVFPDRLEVDFILFIAETQSLRLEQGEMDGNGDGSISSDEQKAWLEKKAAEFAPSLKAYLDGQALKMMPVEPRIEAGKPAIPTRLILKMPGFAGMSTYHMVMRYAAAYPRIASSGPHTLTYEDAVYPRNAGLKRILLEKVPGTQFIPPHPEFWGPESDPTRFEQYDPGNLPQERSATIHFELPPDSAPSESTDTRPTSRPDDNDERGGAASRPAMGTTDPTAPTPAELAEPNDRDYGELLSDPSRQSRTVYQEQADRLIRMLQKRWGLVMVMTVTALAFVWGAAHALMPGHAKTIVAAYLISQKGTYRHAVLLAIVVTITHTALVIALGLVWWYYQATHPGLGPKLQLVLGLISGLLVAGMGLFLIWRALSGRLGHHHHHHHTHDHRSWFRRLFTHSHPDLPAHSHEHGHHDHDHDHASGHAHGHSHTHDHDHGHSHDHSHEHAAAASPADEQPLTFRLILMLGVTGGIVPCPTATIIMLLGVGANVVGGALYAVFVFSLGLALTLMTIGFLALSSRKFATKLLTDDEQGHRLSGWGQWLLTQAIPALSGLAVVTLGSMIAANYIHAMRTGNVLFRWMG